MSAASESSGTGMSNASGRSTPDDGGHFAAPHQPSMHSSSHAFSPFAHAGWGPRRSSTPATAFLPPRFWGGSNESQPRSFGGGTGGTINESANETPVSSSSANASPAPSSFIDVPRRVSFGHALSGGRLGAFAALGFGPSTPYWSSPQSSTDQTSTTGSGSQDLRRKPSMPRSTTEDGTASSSTNTTPAPSMPSSPVQKPQRTRTVYLPGPDGICVESRPKRRSDA